MQRVIIASLHMLRALLFADPLIALDTLIMGTLSMIASIFDGRGFTQHHIARVWARIILWVSGLHVEVEGLEKLDSGGSYVLVSNHLSLTDTPVIMANLPLQFRFFAKKGLFRIPFLGGHLRRAGHMEVVFDDPRAGFKTLAHAARMIASHGISMLVFPEGGRSETGVLREFKAGAAYLAIKAGVPAVPIGIQGTRECLPMGSVIVRPGRVKLTVGDPIPTSGMRPHDHGRLNAELWRRIAALTGQSTPVQCK